jgi:hypothetical protein
MGNFVLKIVRFMSFSIIKEEEEEEEVVTSTLPVIAMLNKLRNDLILV